MAALFQTGPEVAGDGAAEIAVLIASSAPQPSDRPEDARALVAQRLFHLARYNKMLGWLPLSPTGLPPGCQALSADLLQAHLRTLGMNRLAMRVSAELSVAFADQGLRHVVLKGPFQQMALHGQPFRRPSGDIDLYVRPRDRAHAAATLIKLGFRPTEPDRAMWWIGFLGEQHFRRRRDGAVVDLHHSLQQVGLPGWRQADAILTRADTLTHEGHTVHVPCTEDSCLLLAVTMAKALLAHEPCGWAVADLAWWLDRLTAPQWHRLGQIAARSGQTQTLRLGLALVTACYGLPRSGDPEATAPATAGAKHWAGLAGGESNLPMLPDDHDRLRDLVFQPWHRPDLALRRRDMLRMLSAGRPHVLVGQGLRATLSPLVLAWVGRGGRGADRG